MKDWDEIKRWRKARREALIGARMAMPRAEREPLHDRLLAAVEMRLQAFPKSFCIGFYWPFRAEPDFRELVGAHVQAGGAGALPVVVEKAAPLEFHAWRPGAKLERGVWNIPIPAERHRVQPDLLLVPLVGFDSAGYRLGYGGGYYDRTLAASSPRPHTIGVGFSLSRLETIHAQSHDIPLDEIVTEDGPVSTSQANTGAETSEYASPPCYLREADPVYQGFMDRTETLALLNRLLEAERAGARGLAESEKLAKTRPELALLRHLAQDEARYCALLDRHIRRLGGQPSHRVGAFYDKLMALPDLSNRLTLLDRGQGWVVRKIQEALPRIEDPPLGGDLREMLDTHERNREACAALPA